MALHELATNAVKYGALSSKRGTVQIAWEMPERNTTRVRISWRETGGPLVGAPNRKGLGSLLIESALADQGGTSRINFHPQGVACTLELDL